MPNHITNRITASAKVINYALNENGNFDFEQVFPFPGAWRWDAVNMMAETFAKKVLNADVSSHPLVGMLERSNRNDSEFSAVASNEQTFEQFIQMLRNYRQCGFLHAMDYAREKWGTKWNAYDQTIAEDRSWAQFDTAWATPMPVFYELSRRFPHERISVIFADEDTGSNCGTFTLLNGEMVESDIAKPWREQTEEEHKKWTAFACKVKGYEDTEQEDA